MNPTPTEAKAFSPLAPQLLRYAISLAGSAAVGAGLVTEDEAATIGGAVAAIIPPLWLIVTTLMARKRVG